MNLTEYNRERRNAEVRVKDEYLSKNAKPVTCELCLVKEHEKCVKPCVCRHLRW